MKKDIHVGNETITAEANAFTPILYRQVFQLDFMAELQGFAKLKGKKPNEYTDDDKALALERVSAFSRLAFVMAEQGTGKPVEDLVGLTNIDYYKWLTQFEPLAFEDVGTISDILTLWRANTEDNKITAKNA